MPDICMCTGNCPVSDHCYRHMAVPNRYGQSYSCLEDICIPNGYSEIILMDDYEIEKEYEASLITS